MNYPVFAQRHSRAPTGEKNHCIHARTPFIPQDVMTLLSTRNIEDIYPKYFELQQGDEGERAMSIDDYVIGARIPMSTQLQLER